MRFSLVIPLAPERGAEILNSIKEIDYPRREFQVIVVKGKSPSENRNKGVDKAKGEIIGFLDDDAVVDKNLLKEAEKFFSAHDADIVGGPQLTPEDEKGFAKFSGYALSSGFGAWKLAGRYSKNKLNLNADEKELASVSLFCKKKVFEKVKFNPDLFPGEDMDFIDRAKKIGFKVAYSPDLIVYHRRRNNVKGLMKQIFNYGKVRPEKESFFSTIKNPFFLAPSVFSLYLLILVFSAVLNPSIVGSAVGFREI
ncbi:MAG: glycosyltransferase, partial [Nanoarchaeota archaeon]